MNKIITKISLSLIIMSLLTSCSSNGNSNTDKTSSNPSATVSSAKPSDTDTGNTAANAINNFEGIFARSHTMKIKKNGDEKYYDASKSLTFAVADLFSKVLEADSSSKEVQGYDMQKYDYLIQFDGAKDILFSVKDNLAHFDGETKIFKIWGDSSNLWNNIKTQIQSNTADLDEKGLEIMEKSYKFDLNGDNTPEDVRLTYKVSNNYDFKGDLVLRVNNSSFQSVFTNGIWQVYPSRTVKEFPDVKILPVKNSNKNMLLVTYSNTATEFGYSGEIVAFDYDKDTLKSIPLQATLTTFNYESGDTVKIQFPELNSFQTVKFNVDDYTKVLKKNKTLKSLFKNIYVFKNHPLDFYLKDFNGDGKPELCSKSCLLFKGSSGSATEIDSEISSDISIGYQYTFYTCENQSIKPTKVMVAPPYDANYKEGIIEEDILKMIFEHGTLTLGDKGIEDSWYQPSADYTGAEVISTINRFVKENKLKKNGKIVSVNF